MDMIEPGSNSVSLLNLNLILDQLSYLWILIFIDLNKLCFYFSSQTSSMSESTEETDTTDQEVSSRSNFYFWAIWILKFYN